MKEIDARGLKCPQPVIVTKKALEEIQEGQVISIVAVSYTHLDVYKRQINLKLSIIIDAAIASRNEKGHI